MEGYVHGQRSKGRPKRRWIDGLKEDCALLNLTIQDAGSTAQDRRTWRTREGAAVACYCIAWALSQVSQSICRVAQYKVSPSVFDVGLTASNIDLFSEFF